MKKLIILFLFIFVLSCKNNESAKSNVPLNTPIESLSKIGAFNIQIFGESKMSKPLVVDRLAKIVSRYDIVLIQEIRDSSNMTLPNFIKEVQKINLNLDYTISSRLGRSSSKEQYAYIFNTKKFKLIDSFVHSDPLDVFEREPFIAIFENNNNFDRFFLIGIHVKPSDALNELNMLDDVFFELEDSLNLNHSILLGDFNADCSYLSSNQESSLDLKDSFFNWHFNSDEDTTSSSTYCAYDRIITTGYLSNKVLSKSVFNFQSFFQIDNQEALEISDHFPVEINIDFQ